MKKDIKYTNEDVLVLVEMLLSGASPQKIHEASLTNRLTMVYKKFLRSEYREYSQKLIEAIGELRRRANNPISRDSTDALRKFIYRTPFEEVPLWMGYKEGTLDAIVEIDFFLRWRMKIGK